MELEHYRNSHMRAGSRVESLPNNRWRCENHNVKFDIIINARCYPPTLVKSDFYPIN